MKFITLRSLVLVFLFTVVSRNFKIFLP